MRSPWLNRRVLPPVNDARGEDKRHGTSGYAAATLAGSEVVRDLEAARGSGSHFEDAIPAKAFAQRLQLDESILRG
jgi:hypothetical protein